MGKLTTAQQKEIIARHEQGVAKTQLAREYKVGIHVVSRLIKTAGVAPQGDSLRMHRMMISLHPAQKEALEAYADILNASSNEDAISCAEIIRTALVQYLRANGQECPAFLIVRGTTPNYPIAPPSAQISADGEGLCYPELLVEMSK